MDTDWKPVRILIEKSSRDNPRRITLLILNEYFKKKKSLKDIINFYFKNYRLSGLDKRFIFNIVKGTVRYYLKIDFLLSFLSDKKIKDIDFAVLNILRMGIFQFMYMDKVPSYSIVNESVELAKKNVTLSSSKFVNAVLRKVSSVPNIDSFAKDKIDRLVEDEIDKISIDYSYPGWLVKYWFDWYEKDKTILICRSLNENPHIYLRFNKNEITREELVKELSMKQVNGRLLPEDVYGDAIEVSSVQDILETDVYREGLISVQDLSSQIAIKYFLEPLEGEKVLDVCAAPGGKTAYISELVKNEGEVVSVDISKTRLEILKDNLGRLNIRNVGIVEADAAKPGFLDKSMDILISKGSECHTKASDKKGLKNITGYFDKILIDAPCSAFGTISKNPDAKYNKTMKDLIRLSEMSYKIMVNCDWYLKTGGKIVFYTCTLSPIENQQVIGKFLGEFKDKYRMEKSSISDKLISFSGQLKNDASSREEVYFEIMPYYFGSEAGFICSLLKNS
ncbi:MAG: 16S rRNA (cytosine(967)-C(5))-methyltransferase RsmB [Actinomycetia bacterium]|nr:16S rRNA (cytosine(967)-C(5))-methyltransferase RsmB [Actinomycetota bacterium]MCG2790741.1 16S rRNA (cytosine(967)-C(5))-methyltransferase RsmB [Actinomycetes bacterium]